MSFMAPLVMSSNISFVDCVVVVGIIDELGSRCDIKALVAAVALIITASSFLIAHIFSLQG